MTTFITFSGSNCKQGNASSFGWWSSSRIGGVAAQVLRGAVMGGFLILLMVPGGQSSGALYSCPYQDVILNFNASEYQGTWYEIANTLIMRSAFQADCACTTATYKYESKDGLFLLSNACLRASSNTSVRSTGNMTLPLGNTTAALAVTFDNNPAMSQLRKEEELLYPGGANYLVLNITKDDASGSDVAVVGSPCGYFAYILSRSPSISDAAYNASVAVLKNVGYPLTYLGLKKTNQSETLCKSQRDFVAKQEGNFGPRAPGNDATSPGTGGPLTPTGTTQKSGALSLMISEIGAFALSPVLVTAGIMLVGGLLPGHWSGQF